MVLYTEKQLEEAYKQYLEGIAINDVPSLFEPPSLEQFRQIFEDEHECQA